MTTLETRETTQPPARAKLKARIAQVAGNTRGSARHLVAAWLASWGGPDEVARVMHFPFADVCSLITGRVWALDGRGEM